MHRLIDTKPSDLEDPVIYSEIFTSIQGEGVYTGTPTVWLRLFSCNLTCDGFGQTKPTDPSTYELPYQNLNIEEFKTIEDLPVFEKGCDSSYSWSKKYRHLNYVDSAENVARKLLDARPNKSWKNVHLCFTGGEPLTKPNQKMIGYVLSQMIIEGDVPNKITFETNGTQTVTPELQSILNKVSEINDAEYQNGEFVLFSLSPKLFNVSGEKREKAIKPEALYENLQSVNYSDFSLKFVLTASSDAWEELEEVIDLYQECLGSSYDIGDGVVWVMPVGGTIEGQRGLVSGHSSAGDVADIAISKGYNVSARVHNYLWSNIIGK